MIEGELKKGHFSINTFMRGLNSSKSNLKTPQTKLLDDVIHTGSTKSTIDTSIRNIALLQTQSGMTEDEEEWMTEERKMGYKGISNWFKNIKGQENKITNQSMSNPIKALMTEFDERFAANKENMGMRTQPIPIDPMHKLESSRGRFVRVQNTQLHQKRLSCEHLNEDDFLEFEEILSEAILTPDRRRIDSDCKSNQIKSRLFTNCESQTLKLRSNALPFNSTNFENLFQSRVRREDLFSSTKSIQLGLGRLDAPELGSTLASNYLPCFQEVASRDVSAYKKSQESEMKESKSSECLYLESKRKRLLREINEVEGVNLAAKDSVKGSTDCLKEVPQLELNNKVQSVSSRLKGLKNNFQKYQRPNYFNDRRFSVEKKSVEEKKEIKPSKNSEFGFTPSYFTPMEQEELDLKLEELRSSKRNVGKSLPSKSRLLKESGTEGRFSKIFSPREDVMSSIPSTRKKNIRVKFKKGELYNKIDNLLLEIKRQNKQN